MVYGLWTVGVKERVCKRESVSERERERERETGRKRGSGHRMWGVWCRI